MSKAEGRVYIVGAGCGDADLITVRGQNLIENSAQRYTLETQIRKGFFVLYVFGTTWS